MLVTVYAVGLLYLSGQVLAWERVTDPKFHFVKPGRCNCEQRLGCATFLGDCYPDRCFEPYVGPHCQHADIYLVEQATTVFHQVIKDTDDTTCVDKNDPNFASYNVIYKFSKPLFFFWVYIGLQTRAASIPTASLTLYKDGTPLNDAITRIPVSYQSYILISSNRDARYDQLELTGLGYSTCSVEISLGRNLALLDAQASQSSEWTSSAFATSAQEAIDGCEGNTLSNQTGKSCTHTSTPPSNSEWWQVTLRFHSRINLVQVLSSTKSRCSLTGFLLHALDLEGKQVFFQFDQSPPGTEIFKVVVGEKFIKDIKITVIQKVKKNLVNCSDYGVLSLCEVHVFGEFQCPDNFFGHMCELYCPGGCVDVQCDPVWGCPHQCPEKGTFKNCSAADAPDPAKIPVDPNLPKSPAKKKVDCRFRYGPDCSLTCPDGCAGIGDCHVNTGACLAGCKPGFYPPNCVESCKEGDFGGNCTHTCKNCKRNSSSNRFMCYPEDGSCLFGCGEEYFGDNCEKLMIMDPYADAAKKAFWGFLSLTGVLLLYKAYTHFSEEEEDEVTAEKSPRENAGSSSSKSGGTDDFGDVEEVEWGHLGSRIFERRGAEIYGMSLTSFLSSVDPEDEREYLEIAGDEDGDLEEEEAEEGDDDGEEEEDENETGEEGEEDEGEEEEAEDDQDEPETTV